MMDWEKVGKFCDAWATRMQGGKRLMLVEYDHPYGPRLMLRYQIKDLWIERVFDAEFLDLIKANVESYGKELADSMRADLEWQIMASK